MSEEGDVDLARRAYEAFGRRDRAAWLALHDPYFEVVLPSDWPEPNVRGREAAWDFYVDVVFDTFRLNALEPEFVGARAGKVLIHHRNEVPVRQSGAHVEFDYWLVITLGQGRFVRAEWFTDQAAAVVAAGPAA